MSEQKVGRGARLLETRVVRRQPGVRWITPVGKQAGWEKTTLGSERKALVARLYARTHLADRGPLRGVDWPADELERWKELRDGALVDDRA